MHLSEANPVRICYIDMNRQNTLPIFICVSSTNIKSIYLTITFLSLETETNNNYQHCGNLRQVPAQTIVLEIQLTHPAQSEAVWPSL